MIMMTLCYRQWTCGFVLIILGTILIMEFYCGLRYCYRLTMPYHPCPAWLNNESTSTWTVNFLPISRDELTFAVCIWVILLCLGP
jgi:hypothetical protein